MISVHAQKTRSIFKCWFNAGRGSQTVAQHRAADNYNQQTKYRSIILEIFEELRQRFKSIIMT